MAEDIRCQQRFSNYCKALERLDDFLDPPSLNEREQQGLIKAYEHTYELAWHTLREAFRLGLIEQGEAWMLMLQDRNLTSHIDYPTTADVISAQIIDSYLTCFQQLRCRLEQWVHEEAP